MASRLGPSRIMLVGKLVALIGCTIAVLWWLLLFGNSATPDRFVFLALILLAPVSLGAIIWAIGWVVHGFQNDRPRS